MTDSYGGLQFPAQLPEEPVGGGPLQPIDKVLDAIGGYLKAVLNDRLNAMWGAVAPGLVPIVRRVFTANPEDVMVNESHLPALFVWRGRMTPEQMADDIRVEVTAVNVLWLLEPGSIIQREKRLRMIASVAATIDAAIDEGRDPAWIDFGDIDPTAADQGSVLLDRAYLVKPPFAASHEIVPITIKPDDGDPVSYKAINNQIMVCESYVREPATRGVSAAQTATQIAGALTLENQQPHETP